MAIQGSCLCGEVVYEYKGEPALSALCHCTDCQKWSGAGFSSNVGVPRPNFKVVKGSTKYYDSVAASGKLNRHFFCPNCGSSLYTDLEALPDLTFIKAGSLDGGAASMGGHVAVEYFTKDRVSYLMSIDGAKQEHAF